MYNGYDYLSCIKVPATTKCSYKLGQVEPMDFEASHHDLISTANKVFGEGKWNHTVVSQTLDYVETIGAKCFVGCVSFVKIQLDDGNFHEDIGYYNAEGSTKGLSIYNARIGSVISALKRVLLSFGNRIKEELEQLQKQTEQISTKQEKTIQLPDKQIKEKPKVMVQESISHMPQAKHEDSQVNTNTVSNNIKKEIILPQSTKGENSKPAQPVPDQKKEQNKNTLIKSEQKLSEGNIQLSDNKQVQEMPKVMSLASTSHVPQATKITVETLHRLERKRKQLEKQLEFKKRMMEKEIQSNNKPNPKY